MTVRRRRRTRRQRRGAVPTPGRRRRPTSVTSPAATTTTTSVARRSCATRRGSTGVTAFLVSARTLAPPRLSVCGPLAYTGWLGSRAVSVLDSGGAVPWVQIAAATLSGNSLRQTLHTHCASVYQAAKWVVAALLRVARVTAGLAESNGILPLGL